MGLLCFLHRLSAKRVLTLHHLLQLFFNQPCGLWTVWAPPLTEMSPSRRVGPAWAGEASPQPSRSRLELALPGCECGSVAWAGLSLGWRSCWRLALSLALLASLLDRTGGARVSSSLSTTHHVHHFHNKHGRVPIAINRMPILTRGFPSESLSALTHSLLLWVNLFSDDYTELVTTHWPELIG